jgi:hypothetical protein
MKLLSYGIIQAKCEHETPEESETDDEYSTRMVDEGDGTDVEDEEDEEVSERLEQRRKTI